MCGIVRSAGLDKALLGTHLAGLFPCLRFMCDASFGKALRFYAAGLFQRGEGKRGAAMPRKPKRPCSYPGCPRLTEGRFCDEHEKMEARRYEKYDRDPAVRRRYGRAWKRIRDSYAAAHPLCEQCLKEGRYVKTEEIHHKLPLSKGGTHDRENLVALCKECHARIHAKNGDRWHNR